MTPYKAGGVAVFIADTLFLTVAGVVTFIFFLLFSKGTIRLYVILAELLGFLIFRFLFSGVIRKSLRIIQKVISYLLSLMSKPFLWLVALVAQVYTFLMKVIRKYMGKFYTAIVGNIKKIYKYYSDSVKTRNSHTKKSKKVE